MKVNKFNLFSDVILLVSFFSILNNGVFDFGLRLYVILPFIYLITTNNFKINIYNNLLGYELLYFFLLFIVICLYIPFADPLSNVRTPMQRFEGRFITQIIRFALELGVSQYYLIKFRSDSVSFCTKLYFVTLLSVVIGISDLFIFRGALYEFFIGQTHVSGRFTALNIEPRMFGLALVYIYCFLSINKYSNKILFPIIIGIFLTISVSSIIIFLITFFYFNKSNKFLIALVIIIAFIIFTFLLQPNVEQFSLIFDRIDYLLNIKSESDFFPIFSVFEIFDRAALNSLFHNKIYLFTGFGPNTISIPSSYFIPQEFEKTYDGIINSVPHSGVINILSRCGFIFGSFFLLKFLRAKNYIFFVVYLIQANFIFYTFYAILFENDKSTK